MSTRTQQMTANRTAPATAEQKVRAEIQSMLEINGNSSTAQGWVPRVVMMAYERRCANNPNNGELAECFSVATAIAGGSAN